MSGVNQVGADQAVAVPPLVCQVTDTIYEESMAPADATDSTPVAVSTETVRQDDVEVAGELDRRKRPLLAFGTRIFLDADGALHLAPMLPIMSNTRGGDTVTITRTLREVVLPDGVSTAWRLLARLDGRARVGEIIDGLPAEEQETGHGLLATWVQLGIVDVSGRAVRRFLYAATQFLGLPMPLISTGAVAALVADGAYRRYPGAQRSPLPAPSSSTPRMEAFRELTRHRRSPERFAEVSWPLATLSDVLSAACGVTGETETPAGRAALRAHPSGGALYAVEVYPLVLQVDGLAEGVYHYDPLTHELEGVRVEPIRERLLSLCLQPSLLRDAAVVFALTSHFRRSERKYSSPVALRFLAVEAGHVSQNLILAATAAGHGARPFSAWLEPALNELIGLTSDDERYWFSVVAGSPAPADG